MLLDKATLASTASVHPEIKQFLDANPLPAQDWDDYHVNRTFLQTASKQTMAAIGPAEDSLSEEYMSIPMRDNFASTIKIHRPTKVPASGSPLIVLFFGGGWIGGDMDLMTGVARALVRLFEATVVSPSYRLAPEYKFPISQNDCWDTLKWLDIHASELGADPKIGFVVGGISAGATNTAVCVLHSGAEKLNHAITGQWLCVPSLFDEACVPERYKPYFCANEQNIEAPILKFDALHSLSVHTQWDNKSPWRYPVNSDVPLQTLPPTFFQVDGMDPLRDDGLIYDEMLKEAGVTTRLELYPGCPHAFWSFFPDLEIVNKAISDAMIGFGWLLGRPEGSVTRQQGLAAMRRSGT